MVQAWLKAMDGDVDGALQMLDAFLLKQPGNEAVGLARGYLLWIGKGDAGAALQAQRQVLSANPGSTAA